ncbi:MAG: right-handed parallel beta-helix repeat-containing protein [Candidatus Heimdallarchaeaceae archaeon]
MSKKNKNRNKILAALSFFLILISFAYTNSNVSATKMEQTKTLISIEVPPPPSGLVNHTTINVINDNFTDYSFPGSGTKEDPYLIQNLNINSDTSEQFGIPGIYIEDSKKYFTIQNCYVKTRGPGIEIRKVNKGACKVINNYIDCLGVGLEIRFGLNLLVEGNIIIDSNHGIYLESTDGSIILENLAYNNFMDGISLYETDKCKIVNNTFVENEDGISLGRASDCTVANNTCKDNTEYGIRLHDANNNNLMYNTLADNTEEGIYLTDEASNNKIHHNVFMNNNQLGSSQAGDEGTSNIWYDDEINEGNLWSDWIGSGSYQIGGSADSEDLYPLNAIPVFTGLGEIEELFEESSSLSIYAVLSIGVLALGLRFRRKRKN